MDLLDTAGYEFEAVKSGFPELMLEDPVETVKSNARAKHSQSRETPTPSCSRPIPSSMCLTFQRVSVSSDRPQKQKRSGGSSAYLQGRTHEVHSGVAVATGNGLTSRHAVTRVRMRTLDPAEIESYVHHGEGVGKAGGYAVQGRAASFVEWIGGDYTNVVGLPLALTSRMLASAGIPHP